MKTAKLLFPRAVTGKISKLPPDLREFINNSLDDGVAYDQIIAQLAAKGHPGFNKNNLSRWRRTGHLRWLHQRERKVRQAIQFQGALNGIERANITDPAQIADIRNRVLATEICNTLSDFEDFKDIHGTLPKGAFRLFRAQTDHANQLTKQKLAFGAPVSNRPSACPNSSSEAKDSEVN